jgi:hypothetical protein
MREVAGVRFKCGGIYAFDSVGYIEMNSLSPERRETRQHCLSNQFVGELEQWIGMFDRGQNNARFLRLLNAVENRLLVDSSGGMKKLKREGTSDDRGDIEDPARSVAQPSQPAHEQNPEATGNRDRAFLEVRAEFTGGIEKLSALRANLTYVIPGTTVVRTVAGTPEELTKYFSAYDFDQKRLRLKSKGTYHTESDSKEEVFTLSWETDLNTPVYDHIKK